MGKAPVERADPEVAAAVKDAEEKPVSEDVEAEVVGGGAGDSAMVLN